MRGREWWEIKSGSIFPLWLQGKVLCLLMCASYIANGRKQYCPLWACVLRWLTPHSCRSCTLPLNEEAGPCGRCAVWTSLPRRCWSSLHHEYLWFLFAKRPWRSVWPEGDADLKRLCPLPGVFSFLPADDIQNNNGNYWLWALFLNVLTIFIHMELDNKVNNNSLNFTSKNLSYTIIKIFLQPSGQGKIVKHKD